MWKIRDQVCYKFYQVYTKATKPKPVYKAISFDLVKSQPFPQNPFLIRPAVYMIVMLHSMQPIK